MCLCGNDNFTHSSYFILKINSPNSFTDNCSALLLNISSFNISGSNKFFTAFRKVFLRWLNAVFTNWKNDLSSFISIDLSRGNNLITALFTFGGGVKDFSLTSNRYSTLKKACI